MTDDFIEIDTSWLMTLLKLIRLDWWLYWIAFKRVADLWEWLLTFFNKMYQRENLGDIWTSQPAITCSNLTIKTLEQGVKYVQINNKDTRTTPFASFWFLYCSLWTYFTPCSSISIVNFQQVNAGWGLCRSRKKCYFHSLCYLYYLLKKQILHLFAKCLCL